ncbi:fibroblast growth factor 7-like [Arapaima gigas]
MRRWVRTWQGNLPDVLSGLCVHLVLLVGSLGLAGGQRTPEQLAAIANCSRHERHARNYDYMEGGDVRVRQLFSRTQWFLTIDEQGNIGGTQDPTNCYSILEIRTVSEGGVLAIKGVKSQYYISMNRSGGLQGKKTYNENCNFKEVFLENYFNAYASAKWTKQNGKQMFLALSQKGKPLKGRKTRKENISSHFIPLKCKVEQKPMV